jgi:hypothetical protein
LKASAEGLLWRWELARFGLVIASTKFGGERIVAAVQEATTELAR